MVKGTLIGVIGNHKYSYPINPRYSRYLSLLMIPIKVLITILTKSHDPPSRA